MTVPGPAHKGPAMARGSAAAVGRLGAANQRIVGSTWNTPLGVVRFTLAMQGRVGTARSDRIQGEHDASRCQRWRFLPAENAFASFSPTAK